MPKDSDTDTHPAELTACEIEKNLIVDLKEVFHGF